LSLLLRFFPHRKNFFPIRTKFALAILPLIALISFLTFFYSPWMERKALKSLEEKMREISQIASFTLIKPLLARDFSSVQRILEELGQVKHFLYAVVKDTKGKILVSFPPQTKLPDTNFPGRFFISPAHSHSLEFPLTFEGKQVGTFYLGFSLGELKARVTQTQAVGFLISCFIFALGTIVVFGLSALITKPLEQMVSIAEEITRGNLERRTHISSGDEIGRLSTTFDTMVESIERQTKKLQQEIEERKKIEKELENHKLHLEETIAARTEELKRAVKRLEYEIKERREKENQLKISLREKEILLKEIHHRVKNNLQIISSLFNLQLSQIKEPLTQKIIKESQTRIKTMALVHENLYQVGDLSNINFSHYLERLVRYLFSSFQVDSHRISFNLAIEEIPLEVNAAITCGLIVNELVVNCLKHAFPSGQSGEVKLRFWQEGNKFHLSVRDNGVGFSPNEKKKSLGLQLVETLTHQLNGTLEICKTEGTEVKIIFPQFSQKGEES
jgi:two-component sensor histidine kinase